MSADITLYRNDDVDLTITVTDSACVPVDISGADALFVVRKNLIDDPIIELSTPTDIEITITSGPLGELVVHLSRDKTGLLDIHNEYFFDLRITLNGKVYTVLSGSLVALAELQAIA